MCVHCIFDLRDDQTCLLTRSKTFHILSTWYFEEVFAALLKTLCESKL